MPAPSRPTPSSDEALLEQAESRGLLGRAAIYLRLSGPGWLQGAVTLGGGSLAGALYLGILGGPHLLWLQPLAMACGVVMLSAISYVTLSTGERPVDTMSRTLSPVLAIAWIIATIIADLVFCMAQFALATSTVTQNLIPSLSASRGALWVVGLVLAVVSLTIVFLYDSGSRGIRIFENVLKVLVAVVVLAFFGVIFSLTKAGRLDWGEAAAGFVPDLSQLREPTPSLEAAAAATGEHAPVWRTLIADQQRDAIIAAFGSAVGINMTFLLPFSLLRRGWGRRQRGLAMFDLSLGLLIPFIIATSFLVISAWSQFYGRTADVWLADGTLDPAMTASYNSSADAFLARQHGAAFTTATPEAKAAMRAALPAEDRQVAAMLAPRDARQLAATLVPFLGDKGANLIFGIGVFAMAWSTMIVHMLMNGLAFSALLKRYNSRVIFMIGAAMPAITGMLAPILWTGPSRAALAIPASVVATTLLPIAYFGFLLLMNSKAALGEARPAGARRVTWNVLMLAATGAASYASVWAIMNKPGNWSKVGLSVLVILAIFGVVGFLRRSRPSS
ncbi:MAG TPA: divalent metal cation transporter [Candidatus Synoicihabitans sp.]|nr:divalent metal cation transporter [Candidatus Synoicihabitans sp.]